MCWLALWCCSRAKVVQCIPAIRMTRVLVRLSTGWCASNSPVSFHSCFTSLWFSSTLQIGEVYLLKKTQRKSWLASLQKYSASSECFCAYLGNIVWKMDVNSVENNTLQRWWFKKAKKDNGKNTGSSEVCFPLRLVINKQQFHRSNQNQLLSIQGKISFREKKEYFWNIF